MISEIEEKLNKEYATAAKETQDKLDDYLHRFKIKDEIKAKQVQSGEITQREYTRWRYGQIMIGKRWQEMQATLAEDLTNTNKITMSIVNGYTPEAYALNHNYATFEVEKGSLVDTSYTLYDRQTVERLMRDDPDLLPKATVDVPADLRWNKQHINSAITQAVLQGESIPKIAKRLQSVTDMDNRAAVRNARTMMTSAENAGRQDSYDRAEEMGIKMQKQWMSTLDAHTRDSHRMADGQVVAVNESFVLMYGELEYPGDPGGDPAEVYNCRCTMVAVVEGVNPDVNSMERNSKLGDMTYGEWQHEHEDRVQQITTSVGKPNENDYTGYAKDIASATGSKTLNVEYNGHKAFVEFEDINDVTDMTLLGSNGGGAGTKALGIVAEHAQSKGNSLKWFADDPSAISYYKHMGLDKYATISMEDYVEYFVPVSNLPEVIKKLMKK